MTKEEARSSVMGAISMALKDPTLQQGFEIICKSLTDLEKENAELRKVAEFQQSSNMNRHFENKKLKEGLAVGSILNKGLNSLNKALEEERDKYRDMVFDKDDQLTKAKELLKWALHSDPEHDEDFEKKWEEAEQFLSEVEK